MNRETTDFVWNGQNLAAEINGYNMSTYTYDNTGIHMADKDGTVISYIKDYHGSIVGTASSSGKFLQEYNEVVYEAFGNLWDGETPDNFGYSGEYRDDESGLIYLRNRYYDSRSGRFITEDPAQDGLNWYVYCSNNPIALIDPFGLFDYNAVLSYNPNEYNEDVVAMQYKLVELGYLSSNDVDGYFGQKTANAVSAYKGDMGLWNYGDYWGKVGLTTWQSLGLIYRTQADIDRGITIALVGNKQYFDVTKIFNDQLWYAEQYLNDLGPIEAITSWYDKVNHEGDWDIKVRESWDRTFGGSYPGSATSEVVLYGEITTPEKMGNIMYGYTGSAVGFADYILFAGSFYAAWPTNKGEVGAELSDWPSIAKGIDLYYDKQTERVANKIWSGI